MTESTRVVARAWGGGDGELLFNRYRDSDLQEEKSQEICCTTLWIELTLLHIQNPLKWYI